jgi:hypothetical protein
MTGRTHDQVDTAARKVDVVLELNKLYGSPIYEDFIRQGLSAPVFTIVKSKLTPKKTAEARLKIIKHRGEKNYK